MRPDPNLLRVYVQACAHTRGTDFPDCPESFFLIVLLKLRRVSERLISKTNQQNHMSLDFLVNMYFEQIFKNLSDTAQ